MPPDAALRARPQTCGRALLFLALALPAGSVLAIDAAPGPGQPAVFRDALGDGAPGPDLVMVWGGEFQMGSPPEEDGRFPDERAHAVTIDTFALGRYEVTVGEFARFARERNVAVPGLRRLGSDRHPIGGVSFRHAQAFARWLSDATGRRYRLPTEAEWEYAARGGTVTPRFWGAAARAACRFANVHDESSRRARGDQAGAHRCHDGYPRLAPVGALEPNPLGLHDILGNVWEWTCSSYDGGYAGAERTCSDSADGEHVRVMRGGSWQDEPRWVRSALRLRVLARDRDANTGFRIAREIAAGETPALEPLEVPVFPPGGGPVRTASLL